jgi:hypothetical protein
MMHILPLSSDKRRREQVAQYAYPANEGQTPREMRSSPALTVREIDWFAQQPERGVVARKGSGGP